MVMSASPAPAAAEPWPWMLDFTKAIAVAAGYLWLLFSTAPDGYWVDAAFLLAVVQAPLWCVAAGFTD